MRLFVAVYPPAKVVDDLGAVVSRLALGQPPEPGRSLRLAPPEHWHLTLAFLGDVPDADADRAASALRTATAAWAGPAPQLGLGGGGRFGRGRFTIVWVGVRGDVAALQALGQGVRHELKRARLSFDRRPIRPHLTLARPGARLAEAALDADLTALDRYAGPAWTVDELCLVRSHLGPRPRYDVLDRAPLGT